MVIKGCRTMLMGPAWRVWLMVGFLVLPAAGFAVQPVGTLETRNVLMPQPASMTSTGGELGLTRPLAVKLEGPHSERLERAVARMLQQVQLRTGNAAAVAGGDEMGAPRLTVRFGSEGAAVQTLEEDESYALEVSPSGVSIEAATVAGAMHGLQTMLQLIQAGKSGYALPLVKVQDSPRFRWRGLMIDCGRHFEPLEVLKRTLDGMAAVKMNVFHWHLTEDQGFRIESKRFPELTAKGSAHLYYTQAEAREIVAYARDRGIRVVPEFEMPGHSTAWLVAYPELASGTAPTHIRTEFGISDAAMDPTREETYRFLESFLKEMAGVFPDEYVHIGGDETPAPAWKTDPRIRAFMREHGLVDSDALQAYFNMRVVKLLAGMNRRMIGWDEILNPALPKNVVVQSWRGRQSLEKGAAQGYQGILSAPYYLDAMKSAGEHYVADPIPMDSKLTAEQRQLILGGEVCMWSEHIDQRSIDSRIWPRTAAIAERFWSPAEVKDVPDMYRRLEATSLALETLGLTHLSHEETALRQLAGSEDIDALQTFASVLEPVSFSDRYHQQRTTQTTALDHFVDAVPPDQPSRREFTVLTESLLKDPRSDGGAKEQLLGRFNAIRAALPQVKRQINERPLLQDMKARADQMTGLVEMGTEAVTYLSSGTKPQAGWRATQTSLLAVAKNPGGIVRFTFLDALTRLVAAVPE